VRVDLCGVRGSTPTPGPDFVRYGGNTSCVAVSHDGASEPTLVLDAGTGLRGVSRLLDGAPFRGTILLSHLHWDHTQGLPFFAAGDRPDASVQVWLPDQGDGVGAVDQMARVLSPPHFPIAPDGLLGEWEFSLLAPSATLEAEGFTVTAREVPHKGGMTFGFRISDATSSMAYVPDHGPVALGPGPDGYGPYHDEVCELVRGVDLMLHDAQHTADELARWAHFGHSAVDYAVGLGEACGVGTTVLFHHSPNRTDDEVDHLRRRFEGRAVLAAEGTTFSLPLP
jgi:phosphoribosyl 1,2-cyclic phosphodiesterase